MATAMTITETLAHLAASKAWRPGDRVVVAGSGRTGVLRQTARRRGWKVAWDEPRFGVTEGWVHVPNLRLVEPELDAGVDGSSIEITKSQHRALNRVTGFGELDILELDTETTADRSIFVKVGSPHAPLLYAITARGKTTQL